MTNDQLLAALQAPPEQANVGRCLAAVVLAERGDPRAPAALAGALKDENPVMRLCAAWSLTSIPASRGSDPLIAAMKQDQSIEAAIALGGRKDARAVVALIEALDVESLRFAAARSLRRFEGPRASAARDAFLAPLLDTLRDTKAPAAKRMAAADELARLGDAKAVDALRAATTDPDSGVSSAAGWALQAFDATPPAATEAAAAPAAPGESVTAPTLLRRVHPRYPDMAKQARVQGVVILELLVDPSGELATVRVLRGIPLLDGAALAAAWLTKYQPARVEGRPVPVLMTVTYNFKLS